MGPTNLVVVSNRGPLAFTEGADGGQIVTRGGGGLVSSLGPAVAAVGATWIAAGPGTAGSSGTAAAVVEAEGFRVRSVPIDADDYRRYYDVVANATLWFLHHGLFDLARRPQYDRHWHQAWRSFRDVNDAFADAVADEAGPGATVVVHDYHLPLVGRTLAALRPDLRTAYFHHTPFCEPGALAALPDEVAGEMLAGMAGYGACGFHSARWSAAFEACCASVLGYVPYTFVAPAAVDVDELGGVAASSECAADFADLEALVGDRRLIVRVDRIELSKNLLRGFLAFDELLYRNPLWRGRVVFGAFVYPSRETLVDYQAYRCEVETLVARINHQWATPQWTPIMLDTSDRFSRSVAALRRADVLLVNPIRDGLNLVAKEGSVLNERDGVLVLSPHAGAWDELSRAAMAVNPFDVSATADVLVRALEMDGAERAARATALRADSQAGTPGRWLEDQMSQARQGSA
ncbi:MAG: trehalose-6-phosphate synthase [Acidimicrobiales bacterium]